MRGRGKEVSRDVIGHLVEPNIRAFLRIRGDGIRGSMMTLIETKRSRRGSRRALKSGRLSRRREALVASGWSRGSRRAQRSYRIKGGGR
jgi:hypothetical protein